MSWSETWRPAVDGSGVLTFVGDGTIARFEAPAPSRSFLRCFVPAVPGARVDFTYSARLIDVPDPSIPPFGAIDLVDPFSLQEQWDYTFQWREYRRSFTVPFDSTSAYVSLPVGVFNAQSGILEATQPRIHFELDGSLGHLQYVAFEGRVSAAGDVISAVDGVGRNDWRSYDFAHAIFATGDDDDLNNSYHAWIDLNALKRPNGTIKPNFFNINVNANSTGNFTDKRDLLFATNSGRVFLGSGLFGTLFIKRLVYHKVSMVNSG